MAALAAPNPALVIAGLISVGNIPETKFPVPPEMPPIKAPVSGSRPFTAADPAPAAVPPATAPISLE